MPKILIAVQARSGSKRLPGKALELIDDKVMVDHVLWSCKSAAKYLQTIDKNYQALVALLIPTGDPIKNELPDNVIVEGPELDVLARYQVAVDKYRPDYIVRITGDCPIIPSPIISRHVICAIKDDLDYCSNSYDDLRTYIDGYDCEVISGDLFEWQRQQAAVGALTASNKEHVTTFIKANPPNWAKMGVILGHVDLSQFKLSVDVLEELNRVRENVRSLKKKVILAKEKGYVISRF